MPPISHQAHFAGWGALVPECSIVFESTFLRSTQIAAQRERSIGAGTLRAVPVIGQLTDIFSSERGSAVVVHELQEHAADGNQE
jgi:hypothetical protein